MGSPSISFSLGIFDYTLQTVVTNFADANAGVYDQRSLYVDVNHRRGELTCTVTDEIGSYKKSMTITKTGRFWHMYYALLKCKCPNHCTGTWLHESNEQNCPQSTPFRINIYIYIYIYIYIWKRPKRRIVRLEVLTTSLLCYCRPPYRWCYGATSIRKQSTCFTGCSVSEPGNGNWTVSANTKVWWSVGAEVQCKSIISETNWHILDIWVQSECHTTNSSRYLCQNNTIGMMELVSIIRSTLLWTRLWWRY